MNIDILSAMRKNILPLFSSLLPSCEAVWLSVLSDYSPPIEVELIVA